MIGLVTLQAVVDAAKSIEAGFRITQRNEARFNFTMQQPAENGMKVLAATLEKILLKRKEEQFPRSNLGEVEISPVRNVKARAHFNHL